MSLMNYSVDDYIWKKLFQIAKKTRKNEIMIDFLNEKIEPVEFRTDIVCNNLSNYKNHFPKDLESQNCSIEHIREVRINIIFDLSKSRWRKLFGSGYPYYECIVEIIDDKDKIHRAEVKEWWKY